MLPEAGSPSSLRPVGERHQRDAAPGLPMRDEKGREKAYGVCEPASHYFRIMTRGNWMPLLIGERI